MGAGIGLFLGWENGIGVTGTGIKLKRIIRQKALINCSQWW